MGANTKDAMTRANTRCSAPLRRDRCIVLPLRPADDRTRRRRAVSSLPIRQPGELSESRSFASPPRGRFAFSFKQTMPNRSTWKQQILRDLRQHCDLKLCVSCVLTVWRHATRLRPSNRLPASTAPKGHMPGQRRLQENRNRGIGHERRAGPHRAFSAGWRKASRCSYFHLSDSLVH
jgi:hypothetical protein